MRGRRPGLTGGRNQWQPQGIHLPPTTQLPWQPSCVSLTFGERVLPFHDSQDWTAVYQAPQQQNLTSESPFGLPTCSYADASPSSSVHTGGSWSPSDTSASISTSPFGTGLTPSLEYRRAFSPTAYTPPSGSESAYDGGADSPTVRSAYDHLAQTEGIGSSEFSVSATNRFQQPLQGLVTRPGENVPVPEVVLQAPFGRYPAELRPSQPYPTPWNEYQFRHKHPDDDDNNFTPLDAHNHNQQRPRGQGPQRVGVRSQPLTADQRRNAKHNRRNGVCIRCKIFREACGPGVPCAKCSRPHRKWRMGCVREWPKDRHYRLQPPELVKHLRWESFDAYTAENTYHGVSSPRLPINLELTLNIGRNFTVPCRRFFPFGSRTEERDGFRPSSFTVDDAFPSDDHFKIHSPPLRPDFDFHSNESAQLREDVKKWAEEILCDARLRKVTLPKFIFWDVVRQGWQFNVLRVICEHYNSPQQTRCEPAEDALSLLLLNYFMTKTHEAVNIAELEPYLNCGQPSTESSPEVVCRFMKALICPDVDELAKKTLDTFQNLFLDKSGQQRDLFFTLSFILMVVLARNQIAVIRRARVGEKRRDPEHAGYTVEQAKNIVRTMEVEFADHIIGLCQYWYEPSQKKRTAKNEHSGLLFQIRQIMEESAYDMPPTQGLEEIDERSFGATNSARLLSKFYTSIWPL